MKNKIQIMSRKNAEELINTVFPENVAVISFCDPKSKRTPKDYMPLDYKGKCERLMTIAVHDIDIEILEDFGLTFETYFPEAQEIAKFIKNAVNDGLDIICQCEYGQSRSAACAAAIKEYYDKSGIEIFADYRYYPNQLIFNKVLMALKTDEENLREEVCT